MIGEPQGLVVDEPVQVALQGEEPLGLGRAPSRPMVAGEKHLGVVAIEAARLVDVVAPSAGVAHLRASGRVEIVQLAGAVLRHAQGAVVRKVEVHLGGRLGVRRHLEADFDAVDHMGLAGLADGEIGGDEADLAQGDGFAQAAIHVALSVARQQGAVHIGRAAVHDVAGQHVLADRGLQETLRGDDGKTGVDVCLRQHPAHAAIVVDMTVGVDHRRHGLIAAVCAHKLQGRGRRLGRGEGIDDDQSPLALDERHVRDVESAHLIDSGRDLEQAVQGVEPGLAPQAGIDRVRLLPIQKGERGHGPGAADSRVRNGADEPAAGVGEIGAVIGRQTGGQSPMGRQCGGRGVLALHGWPHS